MRASASLCVIAGPWDLVVLKTCPALDAAKSCMPRSSFLSAALIFDVAVGVARSAAILSEARVAAMVSLLSSSLRSGLIDWV